jgi:3-oxoacyl-[acyl-carrier protein] reductase
MNTKENMMSLEGKRALVTGGSEGIGRAIAKRLIAEGGKAAVMARRPEVLEKTAAEIGALAVPGDVSNPDHVQEVVRKVMGEFGGIDILVNNAGTGYFAELADIEPEEFKRIFDINVTGAMLMAREVVPGFKSQGGGAIVNISSTAGTKGFAGGTTYVGTKFALKGMTECWMQELRRHNVRVMLVNPSEVQTGFMGQERSELNPKKLISEDIADAVVGALLINQRALIPEFSVIATNPF